MKEILTSFHKQLNQSISCLKVGIENKLLLNSLPEKDIITTNSPNILYFWGRFY